MTVEGQILGTPAYMSPEQARGVGHMVDRRADIYSLGVILFELLTGELPFRGDKQMLLVQILKDDPPSLRKLNSSVPRDLETICLKCLEKERQKRYVTTLLVADDLQRFLDGKSIEARPVGSIAKSWRWCKRNPLIASLSCAVVASLLLGAVISTYYAIESANNAKNLAEALREQKKATENARLQRDRAQRLLYSSEMMNASIAWNDARPNDVLRILEEQRPKSPTAPDCRSFEWHLLWHQCQKQLHTFTAHNDDVWAARFGPRGKLIVSAGMDGTVRVWNTDEGKELENHRIAAKYPRGVAISPSGNRIAIISKRRLFSVRDLKTGTEVFAHPLENGPSTSSGIAYRPDGRHIAIVLRDEVTIRNAATGDEIQRIDNKSSVLSLVYSRDSKWLVTGSIDGKVSMWNVETGEIEKTFSERTRVYSVAISPDGKMLATGQLDGHVTVYEIESRRKTLFVQGHQPIVWGLSFQPGGNLLLSGGGDRTVKVWETSMNREVGCVKGHSGPIRSVEFSPDGKRLLTASSDGTIKVWKADELRQLFRRQSYRPLSLSENGERVLVGDSVVDLANGETLIRRSNEPAERPVARILSCDGRILAEAVFKNVLIWDVDTQRMRCSFTISEGPITCLALSRCGKFLAVGAKGNSLDVWDIRSNATRLWTKHHTEQILSAAFNRDGTKVCALGQNSIQIWATSVGKQLSLLNKDFFNGASGPLSIDPDFHRVASTNGNHVWVRHLGNNEPPLTLSGQFLPTNNALFSPDGTRLVAASKDATIRMWDLQTGRIIMTLSYDNMAPFDHIAFSADGSHLIASEGPAWGGLIVWKAKPYVKIDHPPN